MKRAQIKKRKSIIPGFGLSMGITVAMLSLLILIPLASVLAYSFRLSGAEFAELMMRPNVVQAFVTSIGCALAAAVLNCTFALPTAVAGITLTKMYSDTGAIGRAFEKLGIEIAYTRTGIIIAMVFIGIPFVVRAIQPVLEKLPATYEEAAGMLGASRLTIFWKVIFPEIRPALLTGFGLALARGIGEYGSVIYISGNSEKNGTQVVSYVIMQKLNSGNVDYEGAAAIALVLLILSFVMLFAINFIQHIASRRTNV